jgi:glycosyltransferase involved in cell wall biosynthesis
MKILITTPYLDKMGGVANYYRVLKPYFPGNVEYFVFGRGKGERLFATLKRLLADYSRFKKNIKHYDLVHVNPSLGFNALVRDGFLIRAAKKRGKKVIVFFHGWDKSVEKKIIAQWLWLFRTYYFKADAIIVLAEDFKKSLIDMGYKGQVFVETTVVDDSIFSFSTKGKHRREGFNLLFLARVEKNKGIYEAIETIQILQKKGMAVNLTVAGDGTELEPAKKYADEKGIPGITFAGYVTGKEKIKVFNSADIYLFPSRHAEGMPTSVLEAMAFGLPVIARPVGGLANFFEDGKMGYMISTSDPQVFADFIEKLISNPELRADIGKYNHQYAYHRFKASSVAAQIINIHNIVLSTGNIKRTKIITAIQNLHGWLYNKNFKYYTLNYSPFFGVINKLSKRINFAGVMWRQFFRLCPLNIRRPLGLSSEIVDSQATIILATAYLELTRQFQAEMFEKAFEKNINRVFNLKSTRSRNFAVKQGKTLFLKLYRAGTEDIAPLLTAWAGELFIKAYQYFKDGKYMQYAQQVADYFKQEHPCEEDSGTAYFFYDTKSGFKVWNASAEISAFLLSYGTIFFDHEAVELGKKGMALIIREQRPDGSWFYGESGKSTSYIDNFHTAFILRSLHKATLYWQDNQLQDALKKGIDYYVNYLFARKGQDMIPVHFDNNFPPRNSNLIEKVDIRDCALAIILFSELFEIDSNFVKYANSIVEWTEQHMKRDTTYFAEKTWLWTNKIPYVDFQAWMLLALAKYVSTGENDKR